ncbi:hypothetical protein KBB06_05050 [Candidatus Gracilibacteria bacterium]|nr:hypothetical protein [Candidatus Gracilibacteria bacterium]
MKKNLVIIIAFIVSVGLSFYAGYKVGTENNAPSKSFQAFQNTNFRTGGNLQNAGLTNGIRQGGAQNGLRGNMASGEIIKMDDGSITLKLNDGGSKIILYSTSTKATKNIDIAVSELKTGDKVVVSGSTNTDGSVTASTIQIRPNLPEISTQQMQFSTSSAVQNTSNQENAQNNQEFTPPLDAGGMTPPDGAGTPPIGAPPM